MNMKQTLQNQLLEAIRTQNTARKRTIRLLLSSIKLSEVNKGLPLEDTEILSIIQKEIKTNKETIDDAVKAGNTGLINESEEDILILTEFLPKQLTNDELIILAKKAIEETGATCVKDIGVVMKLLVPQLAGRASNQDASKVVKDLLN